MYIHTIHVEMDTSKPRNKQIINFKKEKKEKKKKKERERQTERDRESERDRQTDKQRQKDRETERDRDREQAGQGKPETDIIQRAILC